MTDTSPALTLALLNAMRRLNRPTPSATGLPDQRTAPCWAPTCRGMTTWRLLVPSARVYACTGDGCTARRELRPMDILPLPHEKAEGYQKCPQRDAAERGARRERGQLDGGPSRPHPSKGTGHCARCGRRWRALKGGTQTQACNCDPYAPTCLTCTRTAEKCFCLRGRAARGQTTTMENR